MYSARSASGAADGLIDSLYEVGPVRVTGKFEAAKKNRANGEVMGRIKTFPYDPAEDLVSKEGIAIFMADALETGDAAYIAKALGIVACAKGMTELARETGLSREQLYRSFSEEGNPTLKTMLAVMNALGVDMTAKAQG